MMSAPPRRIASAARIKAAALWHRTELSFPAGGTLVLRGATPHDEETARAAQQGDIADLIAGQGLLSSYGLAAKDLPSHDVAAIIGLSSMIYAAQLASICAISLDGFTGDDDRPLPKTALSIFALMMADSDATRQISDWALAPPVFWSEEGNVLGSPSSAFGQVAPSPNPSIPTPPEPQSVSAS